MKNLVRFFKSLTVIILGIIGIIGSVALMILLAMEITNAVHSYYAMTIDPQIVFAIILFLELGVIMAGWYTIEEWE